MYIDEVEKTFFRKIMNSYNILRGYLYANKMTLVLQQLLHRKMYITFLMSRKI